MAASINDKWRKGAAAFSTTLASQKASSATSMSLSSSTGVPTDTAVDFTVGRVDSSGTRTPSTKAVYTGTLSGTTVSNLTLIEGTDQLHAAGTVVEITFTKSAWNDAIDSFLTEHNQDGTHAAVTATSLTTTGDITNSGKIVTDTLQGKTASTLALKDTSGNEFVKFSKTSSAVNEITVTNAATGNAPSVKASGDDTNIDLQLGGQGTGVVSLLSALGGSGIINSVTTGTNSAGGGGDTNYLNLAGLKICWGKTARSSAIATNGVQSLAVTLPVTYTNAPYVLAVNTQNASDNRIGVSVSTVSTTAITLQLASFAAGSSATALVFWMTIGT